MPLIPAKDQETIRAIFNERLKNDVTITYFTQHDSALIVPGNECDTCKETRELLEEVASLSDHIHLVTKDFVGDEAEARRMGIERIPAFVLEGKAKGKVRFFGIPAGYEFSTLIEDLIDVSTGEVELSDTTRKTVEGLRQDVHIQVFVTPT